MAERWYEQAVIYCLDVETFQDSDGDGVGDFAGLGGYGYRWICLRRELSL